MGFFRRNCCDTSVDCEAIEHIGIPVMWLKFGNQRNRLNGKGV